MRPSRGISIVGRLVIAIATAFAMAIGLVPSAAGSATNVSCRTVSGTATFSPALPKIGSTSKVKPTVTIKGAKLAGCTGGVTTGTVNATLKFAVASNCSALLAGASTGARGTETITWNNKQKSTVALTLTGVTKVPTETVASGPVTAGLFKGAKQSGTLTYTVPSGACSSGGLSKVTFKQLTAQTFKAVAAASAGTSCKSQSGSVTITPGLVTGAKKTQTISATTKIAGCSGGGVTSGTGKAVIKLAPSDCSGLAKTGTKSPITETVVWNSKKSSTMSGSSTTGPKVGQATITLKVTKGQYAGLHASTVVAFTAASGQNCTTAHPIKNLTIRAVMPFVVKP